MRTRTTSYSTSLDYHTYATRLESTFPLIVPKNYCKYRLCLYFQHAPFRSQNSAHYMRDVAFPRLLGLTLTRGRRGRINADHICRRPFAAASRAAPAPRVSSLLPPAGVVSRDEGLYSTLELPAPPTFSSNPNVFFQRSEPLHVGMMY